MSGTLTPFDVSVEAQRLECRETIQLRGGNGAEIERRAKRDARLRDALGRADVEQLDPLTVIEAAGKLKRGDVRHRGV